MPKSCRCEAFAKASSGNSRLPTILIQHFPSDLLKRAKIVDRILTCQCIEVLGPASQRRHRCPTSCIVPTVTLSESSMCRSPDVNEDALIQAVYILDIAEMPSEL